MNDHVGSSCAPLRWQKSSYSTGDGGGNECVELALLPGGGRAFRDSKLGENSGVLAATAETWAAFVFDVKNGQLDQV
jgi:hypothetical protein